MCLKVSASPRPVQVVEAVTMWVSDGAFDDFDIRFDAKNLHDPILVIRNRSGRHVQDASDYSQDLNLVSRQRCPAP